MPPSKPSHQHPPSPGEAVPTTTANPDNRFASPSALSRFLGCEYRTYLELREVRGDRAPERKKPKFQLLLDRGYRHEAEVIARWVAEGRTVTRVGPGEGEPRPPREKWAAETLDAMKAGIEIIHQGCFVHERWVGYPDFLVKVAGVSSDLGDYSYEIADAKLGTKPRPDYIFQLLFYDDQLKRLQGIRAKRMRLILGDGTDPAYRASDFQAYAQRIHELFAERRSELDVPEPQPAVAYPYPCSSCDFCDWWEHCKDRRRSDDHLSLVANLSRDQGLELEAHGVHTVAALSALPADERVPRLAEASAATLRSQADLQLRSRGLSSPLYELLEPALQTGLARLPKPSAGDVHFDFEGDPNWGAGIGDGPDDTHLEFDGEYWAEDGLEYLFGTVYEDDGEPVYWPLWATDRAEEKASFEQWVDWLMARLARFPDLHVFHYNAYETTALKRLMQRHATRELEIDELLRRKVFVDLYGITRQAIRAGVESYGLKGMEPVFGFSRNAALKGAIGSLRRWQTFQDTGDRSHLAEIELYNRDDCLSTRVLYPWLLERVPEAEEQYELSIDELASLADPKPLGDRPAELARRRDELRETLTGGLSDDEAENSDEQRALRVAYHLLSYHENERKPQWWAFFDRRNKSPEQLCHEDGDAIGALTPLRAPEQVKSSWQWRLQFPPQAHKLSPGSVDDPDRGKSATIVDIDEEQRVVTYSRGKAKGEAASDVVPPTRLAPKGPIDSDAQEDALYAFGQRVAEHELEPCGELDAGTDLLLRRPPRFKPPTPPLTDEPFDLNRVRAQVRGLDRSALVIQGPPGTGKTWTGARIAVDLLARGERVGVMATSHKAINNVLAAIDEAADEANAERDPQVIAARGWERVDFRGWKKYSKEDDAYERDDRIVSAPKDPGPDPDTGRLVTLTGGTAWHWASGGQNADGTPKGATDSVDVLLIDEAGQVSLADAIAVSQAAESVVLLGDPQQLAHVSQGTHAHGSGESVLAHLLGDRQTVARDRGIFLGTSWRMHPEVCAFISKAMYDDSLDAKDGNAVNRIDSPGLSGSGLRLLACEHDENRGRSPEEADPIAAEVNKLLAGGTYVLRDGNDAGAPRALTLDDILVVAPYNAQVRCLKAKLPDGARVGTVDKFQGQEAPVVFFSMTDSSGEGSTRGLSFLFSRNRLNVAVSRAQALAVVVCSPKLMSARCSTVDDMRLVNMLCQFADAAAGPDARGVDTATVSES